MSSPMDGGSAGRPTGMQIGEGAGERGERKGGERRGPRAACSGSVRRVGYGTEGGKGRMERRLNASMRLRRPGRLALRYRSGAKTSKRAWEIACEMISPT